MYAIIESGGKQYRVQEGDMLKVEKLPAEVGSTVTIDRVLLVGGEKTLIGAPYVEGYYVTGRVLNQDKEKKVLVFHYKAKKNIRVRYGHRQPFTSLLIEKILKGDKKAEVKSEKPEVEKAAKAESAEKAVKSVKTTKAETSAAKAETAAVKAEKTVKTAKKADSDAPKAETAKKTTTAKKASTAKAETAKAETAATKAPRTTKAKTAKTEKTEA